MSEPKRMNAQEQKGLINLFGIVSQAAFLNDQIGKRISSVPRGRFRLNGSLRHLTQLANDLTRTMPIEQREHLRRQLPAIKMTVGVTAQMPRNYDSAYGRWLSFEELDVATTAIRECCRVCTIDDPQQQKQCMYCKLLESLPTSKPDESATGCGYFAIW